MPVVIAARATHAERRDTPNAGGRTPHDMPLWERLSRPSEWRRLWIGREPTNDDWDSCQW